MFSIQLIMLPPTIASPSCDLETRELTFALNVYQWSAFVYSILQIWQTICGNGSNNSRQLMFIHKIKKRVYNPNGHKMNDSYKQKAFPPFILKKTMEVQNVVAKQLSFFLIYHPGPENDRLTVPAAFYKLKIDFIQSTLLLV